VINAIPAWQDANGAFLDRQVQPLSLTARCTRTPGSAELIPAASVLMDLGPGLRRDERP
jgi:hypothetical protein